MVSISKVEKKTQILFSKNAYIYKITDYGKL